MDAFEHGVIAAHDFPHRAHLRLTWLYVRRLGREAAGDRVARGIRALAGSHGHPARYHHTLTRAWVDLVAGAIDEGAVPDFDGFIDRHPELLDKQLPLRYYSADLLWSQEARDHHVDPDVRALPRGASSDCCARSRIGTGPR